MDYSLNWFQALVLLVLALFFGYVGYVFNQPLEPKKKD